jgi:hypothetical protein
LRALTLRHCIVPPRRAVLRSSLLFVYDGANLQTRVCMIDLVRTSRTELGPDGERIRLQHCVPWVDGNNEDGCSCERTRTRERPSRHALC